MRNSQGQMDLKKWDCGVPGKEKTLWEGGLFKLEVTFPDGKLYFPQPTATYLCPHSMPQGKKADLSPQNTPPSHQSVSLTFLPQHIVHIRADSSQTGKFTPPLFHPNVYPSGTVCLSILNEEEGWKPAITIKEILLGIQSLLDEPNPESPAQADAFNLFKKDKQAYEKKIRSIVKDNPAP